MRSVIGLALFLLAAFAAAAAGAMFPPGDWYATLVKPSWTPPNWLFGPVWSVLYLAIGIAGWLLWRRRDESKIALVLWGAQLVLNALWSWLFFGLQSPGAALVDILALWVVLAATVAVASRTCRPAAWLLAPYLAWITFASGLNAAIWILN